MGSFGFSSRTGRPTGYGYCRESPLPNGEHVWMTSRSGQTTCTVCDVPWPGGDSCTSASGRHFWTTSRGGRTSCSVCNMEWPGNDW